MKTQYSNLRNWHVFILLLIVGCQTGDRFVTEVYRVPCAPHETFSVWIVDGGVVRREVYPAFLYGGNDQRYLFIPQNEIWIDHAIAAEEFAYTLAHEMKEQALMAHLGLAYADAHDSALVLEERIRLENRIVASAHERSLHKVDPRDCDGLKQIAALPDSIILRDVYRVFLGQRDSIDIWIVDGAVVRRDIFPDFGFSGNDLAYRFIPAREIWIDGQISCEETDFSIAGELHERMLMRKGMVYDSAYEASLTVVESLRNDAHEAARKKGRVRVRSLKERERGTIF